MNLLNRWAPRFFIRISPDTVEIHRRNRDVIWREEAVIALDPKDKNKVLGIGAAARLAVTYNSDDVLHWPFQHPRCLLSDWTSAQVYLQQALRAQHKYRWLTTAPDVVVHPHPSEAQAIGGLTPVEYTAWRDVFQRSGAKTVYFLRPMTLTDAQVQLLLQDTDALEADMGLPRPGP